MEINMENNENKKNNKKRYHRYHNKRKPKKDNAVDTPVQEEDVAAGEVLKNP